MESSVEIMVVDDTPANLEVISETLSSAGYRVAAAISGERALKRLKTHPPALILLDIQMPGLDGFETCRQIKANPESNHIPIIFITARSDTESILHGFEVGAVDYISKPFQEAELLARVNTHLQLRHVNQLYALEREKAEQLEQLNQQLSLTQFSVDHSVDGILWITPNMSFAYANDSMCEMLGYSRAELLQLSVSALKSSFNDSEWQIFQAQVKEQQRLRLEAQILTKDGQELPVDVSLNYLQFSDGEYYVAHCRDIRDRKLAEEKLQQSNERLRITNQDLIRATQFKDEFLASMSHELRTPLNAVLGFSQLMQRDQSMSADNHEMLQIINRNGEHLLALINDILEMSKIEAGKIVLKPTTVDFPKFLDDLHNLFKGKAEAKHLELTVLYPPEMPRYIQVDVVKLRQILLNLMGNALKFTQQGQISLHTKILDTAPDLSPTAVHLQFMISDTGTGIKPGELESIFHPFIQSEDGKHAHQGTGLGLPISCKFAQLMGGNIQVQSIWGKGSTFYCDILVEASANDAQAEDSSSQHYQTMQGFSDSQTSYRLLVVDDNVDNRALLTHMLSIPSFEVRTAVSGSQAVDINESWHPHLICMDISMPEMSGLEATRRIRRSNSTPKIIAITANAFADDRQAALAAGCDDFIAKPFTEVTIFKRIAKLLDLEFTTESALSIPTQDHWDPSNLQEAQIQSDFSAMPTAWQEHVQQSIRTLDEQSLRTLLKDVPAEHHAMVDAISRLLKDYRYDILMSLLKMES
ncbi:response regulator [Acaryochloris sp. IP29b_bin.148]|uniref:response regulator n=1 Tax=Acaryochloris sp. IP29b_bin.148 TaxID=2969218 RepID=UPI00261583DD|nr:response regulator [Acaryochloris sp. IP29b_bin.148]